MKRGGQPGASGQLSEAPVALDEPARARRSAGRDEAPDELIAAMLEMAELPALLPALAYLTGDLSLVEPRLRPSMSESEVVVPQQGGMSPQQQCRARSAALEAIKALGHQPRGGGHRVHDEGRLPASGMADLLRFITGPVGDEYLPILNFELAVPADTDTPGWHKRDLDPQRHFEAVIIGAGMSGLAAAYRLRQAGLDFTIIERRDGLGGVWLENDYPGCRLDTSNFCYSYSFAQNPGWPHQYSERREIVGYFETVAEQLGLRDGIRFGTEVVSAVFEEESATWRLLLRDRDGAEDTLVADVMVSAVGQLNRPKLLAVPGRESFGGATFHSARWDHSVDLTGKRVAVIGTGASAYQVVPSIVDTAGELYLFQRNPPWTIPTPNYHAEVPLGQRWLFREIPFYDRWFRFYQFWTSVEGRRPFATVDPEWAEPGSVSERNDALRQRLIRHLLREYDGRPDLQEKMVPDYPPYSKRMLRDNGVWARSLRRDHVEVVTQGIEEVIPTGIRTTDGVVREVDVIVWCTGFVATDFLSGVEVIGRGGVELHDWWAGEPRALLGISIPNFPNLFCLYGPNTNLVVNGSTVMFAECAVHYLLECVRTLMRDRYTAMECRQDALDEYQSVVDTANALMAWGRPGVDNWYKSNSGRVSQNWPLSTLEYWKRTRAPDPGHYSFF